MIRQILSSILFLVVLLGTEAVSALPSQPDERGNSPAQRNGITPGAAKEIFSSVQQGMISGSVSSFARHFGSELYISLPGEVAGHYSASQAYYLIEEYLKSYKVTDLQFSTIRESDANPYATGSATAMAKAAQGRIQVYVSLSSSVDRWVIAQINIY
jgi:hypothetical protein